MKALHQVMVVQLPLMALRPFENKKRAGQIKVMSKLNKVKTRGVKHGRKSLIILNSMDGYCFIDTQILYIGKKHICLSGEVTIPIDCIYDLKYSI